LIFGPKGVLFGATDAGGGPASNGTVFSLTPPAEIISTPDGAWTEKILWTPPASLGINPYSTLVMDPSGMLYGTLFGGVGRQWIRVSVGTARHTFRVLAPQKLYIFGGVPDGGNPGAGLLPASPGLLHGTTTEGGKSNAGTVSSLQLPSTPSSPHAYPLSGEVTGANGVL
jgi:hypothetical protein